MGKDRKFLNTTSLVRSLWQKISEKFSRKEHKHVFTPAGEVSAPKITVNPETSTIKELASVGTLPTYVHGDLSSTYNEDDQTLILSFTPAEFTPGTLPTYENKTVVTGATATAAAPDFTGYEGLTTESIVQSN